MNFYDELLTDKPEDKTYPEITAPGLLNAIVKEIWDKEHVGMIKVEYMMGEKRILRKRLRQLLAAGNRDGGSGRVHPRKYEHARSPWMSVERQG